MSIDKPGSLPQASVPAPNPEGEPRLPYVSPRLRIYGSVSSLTAAGSGTMMEGALMASTTRFP